MKRNLSRFFLCVIAGLCFATTTFAESIGNDDGAPDDKSGPDRVIRRSPRQQPIMVSYNDGLLTVSAKQPYENVVMTIINVETGEQNEISLGTVEDEVIVPVALSQGEFLISLICDQNLYSFTISVEDD